MNDFVSARYQDNLSDYVSIIGLGSLIEEASARRTCPNLKDFRLAKIDGYRRVFNKTDSFLARREGIPKTHNRYACLSAVPDKMIKGMVVSSFEIPITEWAYFVEREFEYKLVKAPFEDFDGRSGEGVLCVGDYKANTECEEIVHADPVRLKPWQEFRAITDEPMWRNDLLPYDDYLARCMRAAKAHGDTVNQNWIELTFTADGRSIKEYLDAQKIAV